MTLPWNVTSKRARRGFSHTRVKAASVLPPSLIRPAARRVRTDRSLSNPPLASMCFSTIVLTVSAGGGVERSAPVTSQTQGDIDDGPFPLPVIECSQAREGAPGLPSTSRTPCAPPAIKASRMPTFVSFIFLISCSELSTSSVARRPASSSLGSSARSNSTAAPRLLVLRTCHWRKKTEAHTSGPFPRGSSSLPRRARFAARTPVLR